MLLFYWENETSIIIIHTDGVWRSQCNWRSFPFFLGYSIGFFCFLSCSTAFFFFILFVSFNGFSRRRKEIELFYIRHIQCGSTTAFEYATRRTLEQRELFKVSMWERKTGSFRPTDARFFFFIAFYSWWCLETRKRNIDWVSIIERGKSFKRCIR